MNPSQEQIELLMKLSIEKASQCEPVDENIHPRVGAILWKDGEIIAEAYRGEVIDLPDEPGSNGDHAEFVVLEKKSRDKDLVGAHIFTTLEPCTTRNPPKIACVERIIERGLSHVWIGMLDPNPKIKGEGIQRLRDNRIAVSLYSSDLMSKIEDINRKFIDYHRAIPLKGLDLDLFAENNKDRSLDHWFHTINILYWNKNFHVSRSDVYMHLVEVIGGLSSLASEKRKPGLEPGYEIVSKTLAWWLALCGKMGVQSVENLLWTKFPSVCPYCKEKPHNNKECTKSKLTVVGPDWSALERIGAGIPLKQKPRSINDWLNMFGEIYPPQQGENYSYAFARLGEELGELAEATRVFDEAPGYFISEAADVFAWLMHIENIRIIKATDGSKSVNDAKSNDLGIVFARLYPDRCQSCGDYPCSCPPILRSTIGRIGHESPVYKGSNENPKANNIFTTRGSYRVLAENAIRNEARKESMA